MNKKTLSESDICDKFIRPAIEAAGWDGMSQIYREYPLRAGRVVVRGRRARRDASTVLRADYALFWKTNIPLAVVEAKDNGHALGAGMAQAINYAKLLDVPFSFSSNGDGFVFRDAAPGSGVLERNNGARAEPGVAGHGHRHRQDLHRLPDHLAPLEERREETHPVPGRPEHPDRPDHGQRLPALQGRHGQAEPACQGHQGWEPERPADPGRGTMLMPFLPY